MEFQSADKLQISLFGGCNHLLFEALWGEEEVVQRDKVVLKEPHQQNQVHSISKLHTNMQTTRFTADPVFKLQNRSDWII